jgi:hypothetical protein
MCWPDLGSCDAKRRAAEVTTHRAQGLHVASNLFGRGPECFGLSLLDGALGGEVLRD